MEEALSTDTAGPGRGHDKGIHRDSCCFCSLSFCKLQDIAVWMAGSDRWMARSERWMARFWMARIETCLILHISLRIFAPLPPSFDVGQSMRQLHILSTQLFLLKIQLLCERFLHGLAWFHNKSEQPRVYMVLNASILHQGLRI